VFEEQLLRIPEPDRQEVTLSGTSRFVIAIKFYWVIKLWRFGSEE
jgi:hypothetical protein